MIGIATIQSIRCRELWLNVIIRALLDMIMDDYVSQSRQAQAHQLNRDLDRNAATEWLLYNTSDFYEVCGHANLEPTSVRRYAKKVWAAREEGGYKKAIKLIPALYH